MTAAAAAAGGVGKQVATRWVPVSPWGAVAAVLVADAAEAGAPTRATPRRRATSRPSGPAALLALVRESMANGHARVATQRILMLRAGGEEVPEELLLFALRTLQHLPAREHRRMHGAALAWVRLHRPAHHRGAWQI